MLAANHARREVRMASAPSPACRNRPGSHPGPRSRPVHLALLLAGAALLLLVYPLPRPQLAAPAEAGLAALPPELAAVLAEEYDLNTAFNLAGEQVPGLVEEYYFLVLIGDVPPEQEAAELAQKLRQAAREHDYLGLTGPDPQRNRRALLTALESLDDAPLQGLVVIYLGPVEQHDEIVALLRRRGIEPRYVVYPRGGLLV
jgi:hypothetical protein